MKWSDPQRKQIERWLGWIAWTGWGLTILSWITLAQISISSPVLLLGLGIMLLVGLAGFTALLVVLYRRITGTWYHIGLWIAVLFASFWANEFVWTGILEAVILIGLITAITAILTSVILVHIHRDDSAFIIGTSLLVFVWSTLFAASRYDDLLAILFQTRLWWFDSLICLCGLVLPVGCLAFLIHLLRLIVLEIARNTEP